MQPLRDKSHDWGDLEKLIPDMISAGSWVTRLLHNIKGGVCYPATLVTTADHDDRVVPSYSFKFTAEMQKAQAGVARCENPVLIRVEVQGSHGYRPLDRRIAEKADIRAFVAKYTGLTVKPETTE